MGAVIDLGFCLDLTTMTGLQEVGGRPHHVVQDLPGSRSALPNTAGRDKVKRELDCAAIQALHSQRAERGLELMNSVRHLSPRQAVV